MAHLNYTQHTLTSDIMTRTFECVMLVAANSLKQRCLLISFLPNCFSNSSVFMQLPLKPHSKLCSVAHKDPHRNCVGQSWCHSPLMWIIVLTSLGEHKPLPSYSFSHRHQHAPGLTRCVGGGKGARK